MNALRAVVTSERIEIYRDAAPDRPILVQNAPANGRPYLHPIVASDGRGELTEDAPPHHPWQHGLYVGLNDVNGVGFWTESEKDGRFLSQGMRASVLPGKCSWEVYTWWAAPSGHVLLFSVQTWRLSDTGCTYTLDLDWTLEAGPKLRFGRYDYGGLFLRMPWRPGCGGRALDSEGRVNGAIEQQRARWVALTMRVPGRVDPASIVMMDHPMNPGYPLPWRVDRELGIAPSRCIAGEWHLAPHESLTFRHRLFVTCGEPDLNAIEAKWVRFAMH